MRSVPCGPWIPESDIEFLVQSEIYQNLRKFDRTDQERPTPIYFISGYIECEKYQKYQKVLFILLYPRQIIFYQSTFLFRQKGICGSYLCLGMTQPTHTNTRYAAALHTVEDLYLEINLLIFT